MKVQNISYRVLALGMTGALALMASAGFAAAQDEAAPTKEMIVESMVAEGAAEEQATCLLDALGDDWRRLMGLEGTREESDQETFENAMASCGIEPDE